MEAITSGSAKPGSALSGVLKTRTGIGLVLLVVWLISIGYMASRLKVGWVPHDEGTLGLSAERVLQGQMPHRDFDDYTGGLTYLHALAFRVFGISSASMRYVLFAFFVPWVPAVFYIASRFSSAIGAGAVTLLAVAWSVPNYPGPMPSWYNLFFATWGVAVLLRYLEVEGWRWLFLAGLCGGLSMLAKIAAAYYVAAVLLFFVFREQSLALERQRNGTNRAWFYRAAVGMGLAVFLILLYGLIRRLPGFDGFFFFVLPAIFLVGYLVVRDVNVPGSSAKRFGSLLRMCVPFFLAFSLVWIVFLLPYLWERSTHDLMLGLIATPVRIVQHASFEPPSALACVSMIPFLLPILLAYDSRGRSRLVWGGFLAVLSSMILLSCTRHLLAYGIAWSSIGTAIPVVVAVGVIVLWKNQQSVLRKQQIMLLLCAAALCSLVQFPFSVPVYFMYVAPLLILAAAALLESFPHPPKLVLGILASFYALFALFGVTPYHLGLTHETKLQTRYLSLPRAGGLSVEASDVQTYERLILFVKAHAKGKFIYAAPDCPEVYFLSGLSSPSRHYFEYAELHADYPGWVMEQLKALGINVVAIKIDPRFSAPLSSDLASRLEIKYPHSAVIGDFLVMWKE